MAIPFIPVSAAETEKRQQLKTPIRIGFYYAFEVQIQRGDGSFVNPAAPGIVGQSWLKTLAGDKVAEFTVLPAPNNFFSLQLSESQTLALPPETLYGDFICYRDGLARWELGFQVSARQSDTPRSALP